MTRVLALLVVLQGCFIKPERHPQDSSDAHAATDGTSSDGIMADADPRAPNRMFITSGTFKLNGLTGLAAYNAATTFCQNAAFHATNPIPAHYLPWLSFDGLNASDQLRAKNARAWIRMDGAPIADTVDDLSDGTLLNAPARDENNSDVGLIAGVQAMTGTTRFGVNDVGFDVGCTMGMVEVGLASATNFQWTENGPNVCSTTTLRLYCFGYDRDGQLP